MSLNAEERRQASELIVKLYGSDFAGRIPTERTVEILEDILIRLVNCDRKIKALFASVPCTFVRAGFLRHCLKAVLKIVEAESIHFRGCMNFLAAFNRTELWHSMRPR